MEGQVVPAVRSV